ncbi:hypothetical protein [Alicyclobacillus hesperidum]|uniref:hypothetical protein n=1 Tax=Alicyclobacillus hesperidum TaxID=89784 RepID=UPI0003061E02|nr:hypothetical protein [Alicyclobacillus hesperidum]
MIAWQALRGRASLGCTKREVMPAEAPCQALTANIDADPCTLNNILGFGVSTNLT